MKPLAVVLVFLFSLGLFVFLRQPYSPDRIGSSESLQELTHPAEIEWGSVVDPSEDCEVTFSENSVNIEIPGTEHNLRPEKGQLQNAPRVLTPVTGDFEFQVEVAELSSPDAERTSSEFYAYHGTGLLIWGDEQNFVRLERAVVYNSRGIVPYLNFECYSNGKQVATYPKSFPRDKVYLRLQRRGGQIAAFFSDNAKDWYSFPTVAVPLPRQVRIGVAAINSSVLPLQTRLSEFATSMPVSTNQLP